MMDAIQITESVVVPTIPSELIEDDILAANSDPQPLPKRLPKKQPGSSLRDQVPKASKRVLRDELKTIPRVSNDLDAQDIEDDIILQNAQKTAKKSRRSPKRRRVVPYPKPLVNGVGTREELCEYDELTSILVNGKDLQRNQIQSLKRFKRFLPSFSSTPLTQELYEQEVDTFQMNLCLERDLFMHSPKKSDFVPAHLKQLSKSSLSVADAIADPTSVKRAFFNQQRQWRANCPLDALAGSFYARSPFALSHLEHRSMSGRMQRLTSSCAKRFFTTLTKACPSDDKQDKLNSDLDANVASSKLEETGRQIYRQVTQYMTFLAGSKSKPISPDKLSTQTPKSGNMSDALKMNAVSDLTKASPIEHVTARGVRENEKRVASSLRDIPVPTESEILQSNAKVKPAATENTNAKEDGELSDNADAATGEANAGEDKEDSFLDIHPPKHSENEESSDHESNAGSIKKKKKKRKKSKSSTSKKERKKKKKDKKTKDERSDDELPMAYRERNDEQRIYQRQFIPHHQNRPFIRRGGFYQWHQRGGMGGGGFRNFRHPNFRFRGGGPMGGGRGFHHHHNYNYNPRFQRGPPGNYLNQRHREKRFVSESSSDPEETFAKLRSKRSRTTSGRKSPSVSPKREIIVKDRAEPKGGEEDGGGDGIDTAALNLVNDYA